MQRLEHHFIKKCSPSGTVERQDYFFLNFGESASYRLAYSNIHPQYIDIKISIDMVSPEKQLSNCIPFRLGSDTAISHHLIVLNARRAYRIILENKLEGFMEKYVFEGCLSLKAKCRL